MSQFTYNKISSNQEFTPFKTFVELVCLEPQRRCEVDSVDSVDSLSRRMVCQVKWYSVQVVATRILISSR